jgi:hypothetical protein
MKLRLFGLEASLSRARSRKAESDMALPADPYANVPAWAFALERVRLLHGETVQEFLGREGLDAARFRSVLVCGEGYRSASGGGSVAFAALEDLAANALQLGCAWVLDPRALGFSGFQSRSTSGFGVAVAGLGFGFASPDGTFSEGLHLVGTGLVPRAAGS